MNNVDPIAEDGRLSNSTHGNRLACLHASPESDSDCGDRGRAHGVCSGAFDILSRYANHTSAYVAMNEQTQHFTSPGVEGFIAYRSTRRALFQFGGVFAPAADREALLGEFLAMAERTRKHVCVVQLLKEDIDLYQKLGFRINQLGASYTIELSSFTTAGTRFMTMRNKIARALKAGVAVAELGVDMPRTEEAWASLRAVSDTWLRSKGQHAKMIEFMVGELGVPADVKRRIFVALRDQKIIAYITYVPSYGRYAGVLHDLTRRLPDVPPGVMELINVTALQRFRTEGIKYMNLGFTPFTGLPEDSDAVEGGIVAFVVRLLARYGHAVYPANTQVQYKLKWNPQIIIPEYVAFHGRFRWTSLWQLLLLTRVI
jgi:lysylphosphatidylglycerol synthetase-like protein (DUF2156 family)